MVSPKLTACGSWPDTYRRLMYLDVPLCSGWSSHNTSIPSEGSREAYSSVDGLTCEVHGYGERNKGFADLHAKAQSRPDTALHGWAGACKRGRQIGLGHSYIATPHLSAPSSMTAVLFAV